MIVELMLDVKVPVHRVCTLGMALRKRDLRLRWIKSHRIKHCLWERTLARPQRVYNLGERKPQRAFTEPVKWKGQHVEHSESATKRSFSGFKRIPGKPHPGFEVTESGIGKPIIWTGLRRPLVKRRRRSKRTMHLARQSHYFVP